MIEPGIYALLITAWLFWFAARMSRTVDIGLGLLIAVGATLMGLRAAYLIVGALRAISPV